MGGPGSGRALSSSGKATTEQAFSLDIRRLQRAGALSPGRVGDWRWRVNKELRASIQIHAEVDRITLSYPYTLGRSTAKVIEQTVRLETKRCTFGGRRYWFTCPSCGQRVALLYRTGGLFACRRCKGLSYASQNETDDDRAIRRVNRIRKRLGWAPGILNEPGSKPKGMHWRTYQRLVAQHDASLAEALECFGRRLAGSYRMLDR